MAVIHGDPDTKRNDNIVREIAASELDDPEIMLWHFKQIAYAPGPLQYSMSGAYSIE